MNEREAFKSYYGDLSQYNPDDLGRMRAEFGKKYWEVTGPGPVDLFKEYKDSRTITEDEQIPESGIIFERKKGVK
jgi:hypothetical protein